jgi:hypothetical protein
MAKLTNRVEANGTSFHNTVINTTVNKLTKALGEAQIIGNDGKDKVNFDWICETENGDIFTIYDWKEYRVLDLDEVIEFHIGGKNRTVTQEAKEELLEILD